MKIVCCPCDFLFCVFGAKIDSRPPIYWPNWFSRSNCFPPSSSPANEEIDEFKRVIRQIEKLITSDERIPGKFPPFGADASLGVTHWPTPTKLGTEKLAEHRIANTFLLAAKQRH
jgi:hypothetical protein